MGNDKRRVHIIIDNCAYTPDLFQATLDLAIAAKHSGYADMQIVLPPALLYELSGYKAANAERLLSPQLRKDKGVRSLRAFVEYGMQEGVLQIPNRSQAEIAFFKGIPHINSSSGNSVSVAGPHSPADFADSAIVEWLRKNMPDKNTHCIVATQDSGVVDGLIKAIPGDINAPDHLNYFEQCDQKSMALWLAEETRHLKEHYTASAPQSRVRELCRRLDDSLAKTEKIKSGYAPNTKRIEKMLARTSSSRQTGESTER